MKNCTKCKVGRTVLFALVAALLGVVLSLMGFGMPVKVRGLMCKCQRCKASYDCAETHCCYD